MNQPTLARPGRDDRHRAANRDSLRGIRNAQGPRGLLDAASEILGVYIRNAAVAARVPVVVEDVHAIVHEDRVAARVIAVPVPRHEHFARSQRAPSDPSEPAPDRGSDRGFEAEERHQGRTPDMPQARRPGVPSPAVSRVAIPAAPVIRSPAPRLAAHPSPSVVVDPHPAPVTIRHPVDRGAREPRIPDPGHVAPIAMVIEHVRAVDVAAQVPIGPRPPQLPVALGRPFVQSVLRTCLDGLHLRSVGAFANCHRAPAHQGADGGLESHVRTTLADGDDRFTGTDGDPVAPGLHRSHRRQGRLDVDVRDAVGQFAVDDGALDQAQPELLAGDFQQLDFRVVPEPDEVSVIELNFGARSDPGLHRVSLDDRHVDRRRHPVAGIAAHRGDVPADYADSGDAQGRARPRALRGQPRRSDERRDNDGEDSDSSAHWTVPPSGKPLRPFRWIYPEAGFKNFRRRLSAGCAQGMRVVRRPGLEPGTHGLKGRCSTN